MIALIVLIGHSLLLDLLFSNHPFLFTNPTFASEVKGDDHQQYKRKEDNTPGYGEVHQSIVGDPEEEPNHDSQDCSDHKDDYHHVREGFTASKRIELLRYACKAGSKATHTPYVFVLPKILD